MLAKIHHNEVAPSQFELALYFDAANVTADHQQLLMLRLMMRQSTRKLDGLITRFLRS
jgi:glutamine synthetase